MKRIAYMAATTAFLISSAAHAAVDAEALGRQWYAKGYTAVEVTVGRSQVKVEGIRGGQKVEAIYDAATGAVLKQETGAVEAGDDIRDGILLRQRNRDFVRVASNDDDDADDNPGDDEDRGGSSGSADDDDDSNDDHGSSSGSDDDGDDDHSGSGSDDGSEHDGGDDHGGDRGGDDSGGGSNSGRGGSDD